MQERQDISRPREPDMRIVLSVAVVCAVGGFIGSTVALEYARESSVIATELLKPPISILLQASAGGWAGLLGMGIGFSAER